MANMWGATPLEVVVGSATVSGGTSETLVEMEVLPNPSALGEVSTVVQQQGRKRNRVKARLCVNTMSEYNTFIADKDAGEIRTLTLEITDFIPEQTLVSGYYAILSVGEPSFVRWDQIYFDINWLEMEVE